MSRKYSIHYSQRAIRGEVKRKSMSKLTWVDFFSLNINIRICFYKTENSMDGYIGPLVKTYYFRIDVKF